MPVYKNIYDGPPRGYGSNKTKKRYIAIHNTSNSAPAVNEASYAKRRTDSVSSHYYVDKDRLIQSLDTDLRAWHAGSSQGNNYAISYEFVGTNSKSRDWWLKNIDWDKVAKQIATDMKHFGIANRQLTSAQMRAGNVTGIVTHNQMSTVWGGSTHNDPGPNFPMDHLIKKINQYLNPAPAPKPEPPKEEPKMNLNDRIKGTDNSNRTVEDVLADLANLRNYLVTPVGTRGQKVDPPKDSPLDLLERLPELEKKLDMLIALLQGK